MKPPLGLHPTFLLVLWGLVIALWTVSLRHAPFHYPVSLACFVAGGFSSAWIMLARAFIDLTGGDEYLRRVMSGHTWYMGPYWWVGLIALLQFLAVFWLIILCAQESFGWFMGGQQLGILAAGYPHWRSQWRRMQKLAQEEQAGVTSSGGAAV